MLLNILLVLTIIICIALVGVILLQRSEGGALGMSGGGPGAFMTARGTGDFLSTATQVLAALFFALCLIMTLLSGRNTANSTVLDRMKLPPAQSSQSPALAPTPGAAAPAAPPSGIAPAPSLSSAPPPASSNGASPLNPFGPNTAAPAKTAPAKSSQ